VDLKHIALDLKFDRNKKQVHGLARITFSLLEANDLLALDAAYLSVHSVEIQGGPTLKFNYQSGNADDNLKISLDRKYKAGETITVSIRYHTNRVNDTDPANIAGSDGKSIRFFEPSSTEPNRRRQVWGMGEGEGNRSWFPCFDAPGDLRTSELKAMIEKPLMVISNGELISKKENPDGTTTFHYKMDKPFPNHKTAFVAGEYELIKNKSLPFNNYAYPDEKEATIATIERLGDMAVYFSAITGKTYPYENYAQVFVQELPGDMHRRACRFRPRIW
jgi:aminopeptidase N